MFHRKLASLRLDGARAGPGTPFFLVASLLIQLRHHVQVICSACRFAHVNVPTH